MIKNVIFDFGQVLVHFDPHYMTSKYVNDKKDLELLEGIVFDRLYWDRLDSGTIEDEEALSLMCERLPKRLHSIAREIYYNWIYNIPEIDKMSELITYIKDKYKVSTYLLSNISRYFADHKEEIPILKKIDYCEFSAVCGLSKPDEKIFRYIMEKYKLSPYETVFIDDNIKNVTASNNLSIKSFLFENNPEKLKVWLDKILSENY